MVVYIVQGSTGEYEDFKEWIAGVFITEEEAKRFQLVCQKDADYMLEEVTGEKGTFQRHCYEEYKGHDPEFQIDYTGTLYNISEHIIRDCM